MHLFLRICLRLTPIARIEMRLLAVFLLLITEISSAQNIPPKAELDAVMQNAVKQMNSQMSGLKVDEYTTLKFVAYDTTPPLFTYFYSSSALSVTNQQSLTNAQIAAMNLFNINKTCTSNFKVLMKPYNLKVAHIMEDSKTGKNFYKLTVSHADC
jgi:hypothetical protein